MIITQKKFTQILKSFTKPNQTSPTLHHHHCSHTFYVLKYDICSNIIYALKTMLRMFKYPYIMEILEAKQCLRIIVETVSVPLCLSVTWCQSHLLSVSLCFSVTLFQCHFVSVSLCVSVTWCQCHLVSVSLCINVTWYQYHFVSVSLCASFT